ncbi:MAG: N-acetylmuramoyl-L-alanine amidase [Spiribacter salinus]|uniref:N-acetylmuramoyl-L-alanine amidase n=1 Tax=Spiribacter salinus TaxID=1335746 RepID=A0A540VRQ9_9GAMM|nr:MAG: N-acetylmuramoyl-L-alanine amidase [Spiribacter salinus]
MKIAIIVGHNKRAPGAVRATDGISEFKWNSDLADLIHACGPQHVSIFYRTPQGGYSAQIDRVYGEVDEWGADVSLELHFNSFNKRSHGCETLSSGTQGSLLLARKVQAATVADLPVHDRGVKVRDHGQGRGWRSLWSGQAPAIITEPYFGSNPEECRMADDFKEVLAESTYNAACEAVLALQGGS